MECLRETKKGLCHKEATCCKCGECDEHCDGDGNTCVGSSDAYSSKVWKNGRWTNR